MVSLRGVTSGTPRMVIRKGTGLPKDLISTSGLTSASAEWLPNTQWAPGNDYTAIPLDSTGKSASGRRFVSAYGAPMGAGTYIVGVTKDPGINTVLAPNTPSMSYSIQVQCVGEGLDYGITTLPLDNTASPVAITGLAERESVFYKVSIPGGTRSWRVKLKESIIGGVPPKICDGMFTVRKALIPAFDSDRDPGILGEPGSGWWGRGITGFSCLRRKQACWTEETTILR